MSTALVIGANRGIGLELARALRNRHATVVTTSRESSEELRALDVERIDGVDVTTERGRAALVRALGDRALDVVFFVAGVLESDSLDSVDPLAIARHVEVNAIAPIVLARSLLPNLRRGAKLAFLTSRMGSIADNGSGGYYAYRMSKAALNAGAKSLALDLAPRGVHVAILHPGFVRTRMTGHQGLIDPAESAKLLLARVDALDAATSGTFFHADGSVLPW